MCSPSLSSETILFLAAQLYLGDHEDKDHLDPVHRTSTTSHPRKCNTWINFSIIQYLSQVCLLLYNYASYKTTFISLKVLNLCEFKMYIITKKKYLKVHKDLD